MVMFDTSGDVIAVGIQAILLESTYFLVSLTIKPPIYNHKISKAANKLKKLKAER